MVFTPTVPPQNKLRKPQQVAPRRLGIPLEEPYERFLLKDLFKSWGVDHDIATLWVQEISRGHFVDEYTLFHAEIRQHLTTSDCYYALRKLSKVQKQMLNTLVLTLDPETELAPWPIKLPGILPGTISRSFENLRVRKTLVGFTPTVSRIAAVSLTEIGWFTFFETKLKALHTPEVEASYMD